MNMMLVSFTNMESKMIHFERCLSLSKIRVEKGYQNYESETNALFRFCRGPNYNENISYSEQKANSKGEIRFENVSARYREDLPKTIDGISIKFHAGEKIGIIGRTGAGKSTFVSSIYRGIETCEGDIYIDDQKITELDLKSLRSCIAVIPQEAYFFKDTLQNNIDPTGEWSPSDISALLSEIGAIERFKDGLGFVVEAEGANLSVGERQVVQLARAIVKGSKVIIMDEATSSVDVITEEIIQNAIKKKLSDCTILTIAHRVHTIKDCDKVLVLERGRVLEFGSPDSLQKEEGSAYRMVLEEVSKQEKMVDAE